MPPINRNPSVIARSLAYAGDFSLGQLIFHGLISLGHVRAFYEGLREVISLQGPGGDALASLLAVYMITTILRFYTSLFLGVSFFQWFLGISAGTTGLSGRLLCGGRVALEFLLLPMLIPLLPLLVNKSSWVEQLSGASLKKGQGLRGALGYMARPIVLAFIFLGVFAPLFRNLAVIEGVHVEFSQLPPVKLDASMDFNKFRFFASKYFDFTTFGDLENNRFILLPQFEVTKEMNQTLIKPFLGIYDERGQTIGFLKKEGLLDWGKLIAIAERGNPFFRSSYPFLASEMNSDKEFSEQAMNDLEELVIASLELSIRNVFRHVKMHGPFLGGYVDLRQTLLAMLDSGTTARADTINLGNRKYLRFRLLFDEVPAIEKKYREILLPMQVRKGDILRYEWDANMEAAIARRDFSSAFFNQARWSQPHKYIFDKKELSTLSLIDYLLSEDLSQNEKSILSEYVYQWLWEVSRRALKNNDSTLINWLDVTMGRIYLVIGQKSDQQKLAKLILMLRHSLSQKDRTFFELDKKVSDD